METAHGFCSRSDGCKGGLAGVSLISSRGPVGIFSQWDRKHPELAQKLLLVLEGEQERE